MNILIYAYDLDGANKRSRAVMVVQALGESESGVSSAQALRGILRQHHTEKCNAAVVRETPWHVERLCRIAGLSYWRDSIPLALDRLESIQVSFWDVIMVRIAFPGRPEVLMSEDFNDGQVIEGIRLNIDNSGALSELDPVARDS